MHVQACSRKHTTVKMVLVCACAVCSIKISSSFFFSILFMFPMYLLYSLSCCDFLRFCFLESSIPYSSILHSVKHAFYIPMYIHIRSIHVRFSFICSLFARVQLLLYVFISTVHTSIHMYVCIYLSILRYLLSFSIQKIAPFSAIEGNSSTISLSNFRIESSRT